MAESSTAGEHRWKSFATPHGARPRIISHLLLMALKHSGRREIELDALASISKMKIDENVLIGVTSR